VGSAEYPFINLTKSSGNWHYGDNSSNPGPDELDANGYPIYGAKLFSHGGVYFAVGAPSQAERPGNYVLIWVGSGKFVVRESSYGRGTTANVSCSSTHTLSGGSACDNSNCSPLTGSISGTTLTVTAASSCKLIVGQPISGAGITISKFGVPTIITAFQSGRGGVGTYSVNFAQTVPSESINPGGRYEFSVKDEITTSNVQWLVSLKSTASPRNPANTARYVAFFHAGDEKTYWTGEIFSPLFRQRLKEGNFSVIRDLNWSMMNTSNCTTWATRKPATYWSYGAPEMRKSLYAGEPSYAANTVSFTASISNGWGGSGTVLDVTAVDSGTIRIGQNLSGNRGVARFTRITAQISGTPGGIGTYTVSKAQHVPRETMRLTSNDYAVTFGTGAPVDKETIIVHWGRTSTNETVTLNLNGTGPQTLLLAGGFIGLLNSTPIAGYYATLVYDATLKGWLHWGGRTWNSASGLNCGVPPEVFVQLNAEMGTNPWIVEYYMAADPITDFYTKYATYIRDNYPNMVPLFETPNEIWNGFGYPTIYAQQKPTAYAALDPAWKAKDYNNWLGKVASLLGQAISAVYGGDTRKYRLVVGVPTNRNPKCCDSRLLSTSYLKQNPAKIRIQPGFAQTPAYKWATNVAVYNYWNLGEPKTQREVADAYNYFNGSPSKQAAIMSSYLATALDPKVETTIASDTVLWQRWNAWATSCAGAGPPCGITEIIGYEGTYSNPLARADMTVGVTGAINGKPCVLKTKIKNGAVAGMTIGITKATGGAWSTINGKTYTVQSSGLTENAIPIDLDCTSLGTLARATLTYTGSKNYIDVLRSASWLSPELETYAKLSYTRFLEAGGSLPSQFTIASRFSPSASWGAWSFDIYGYWPMATSTLSKISGTTLTVGGKVTGLFQIGQTILGGGVTRNSVITAFGSGRGGVGTYTLSRSSSVSGIAIGGYVLGPSAEWKAIVDWSSRHNFLLKRDLDPASHDNTPMWIEKAA
jgi:hypothetical protein